MELQPNPTPRKSTHVLRKSGIIALIIVAIVIIAVSVFILMNPNGTETNDRNQDASAVITDSEISPSIIKIKQGDTVTWSNESVMAHKLVATAPDQKLEGFGSDEAITQDESYSFTFDTKGSFTYEDPSEPEKIKGTVIVE